MMAIQPPRPWIPFADRRHVAIVEINDRAAARCHVWYSGWTADDRLVFTQPRRFVGIDGSEMGRP